MTRKLTVRPHAEAEAIEAAAWYQEQSEALAARFTEAFRSALTKVVENPFQYQIVEDDVRRAAVGRFPYGLLYEVSDDEIVILSCFHGRRDPARWRDRLK
jgi:plasmid stabilization system protein ParE